MLCEICKKNHATTHLRQVINGEAKEYILCSECASKLGFTAMMNPFSMSISDMLGSMLAQTAPAKEQLPAEQRCKGCGATFADIRNSGKAGCAECYATFYEDFVPSLQRIHGQTEHAGKVPSSAGPKYRLHNEIQSLQKELKEAVASQDYERAAVLRDRIKDLEATEDKADE
ncbi:UvrB/UvrC motif-containing protein [Acetanaerobacterium elongatum]|uniref:Protein arginine kinase activator n=1 Tax=Acetanaerobacterium elongatum TaxID=258515 RepID=A0A1H0AFT7_9FIRM|nr:UvrB/UvrC motif-containing protein [Acetanaerobacterium elongatum]SDN32482.1 protein arginine kinase activator [Acetanaerobacterium elongatum]